MIKSIPALLSLFAATGLSGMDKAVELTDLPPELMVKVAQEYHKLEGATLYGTRGLTCKTAQVESNFFAPKDFLTPVALRQIDELKIDSYQVSPGATIETDTDRIAIVPDDVELCAGKLSGTFATIGSNQKTIQMYKKGIANLDNIATIPVPNATPSCLANDGSYFALGTKEGALILFDQNGIVKHLSTGSDQVIDCAVHTDKKELFCLVTKQNSFFVNWYTFDGQLVKSSLVPMAEDENPQKVTINKSGSYVVIGGDRGNVYLQKVGKDGFGPLFSIKECHPTLLKESPIEGLFIKDQDLVILQRNGFITILSSIEISKSVTFFKSLFIERDNKN